MKKDVKNSIISDALEVAIQALQSRKDNLLNDGDMIIDVINFRLAAFNKLKDELERE